MALTTFWGNESHHYMFCEEVLPHSPPLNFMLIRLLNYSYHQEAHVWEIFLSTPLRESTIIQRTKCSSGRHKFKTGSETQSCFQLISWSLLALLLVIWCRSLMCSWKIQTGHPGKLDNPFKYIMLFADFAKLTIFNTFYDFPALWIKLSKYKCNLQGT